MLCDVVTGYTREPSIILEWFVAFLFLETGLISVFKHLNAPRDKKSQYDIAFASLFINVSARWVFVLLGDFYASSPSRSDLYLGIGGIIQVLGCIMFAAFIERKERFGIKWFFTACFAIFMGIVIVSLFFDFALSRVLLFLSYMIFAFFFTIFYFRLGKKSTLEPGSTRATIRTYACFLAFGLGHGLTSGIVSDLFDPAVRLVGDAIILCSVPGMCLFIARMPPFIEIDWHDKLESLFIMHPSGICIYNHYFNKPAVELHESLVTSVITSVRVLLEKITDQGGISVIKKDQNTIIIFPGRHIFCVLICKEDIEAGRFLVKKMTDRIENVFSPILDQWDGEMAVFEPIDLMRAEIFHDVSRRETK